MTALPRRLRVVGAGRAGGALALALGRVGWEVAGLLGRGDDVRRAAEGVDLLVIATPDAAIATVAASVEPVATTVVAHLAGSQGLAVLAPHVRRAALHPLMTLPDAERGAARLPGAWFAVAGDPLAHEVVRDLGGRGVVVADVDRARYHAAAAVASNHVVAVLGQVERLAASVGVPLEAFLALTRASVDNVEAMGAQRALTGPAARGDEITIARHLAALPEAERPMYEALVTAARRLASGDRTDRPATGDGEAQHDG